MLFPGRPVCDSLCHTASGARCLPFSVKVFCNGYAGAVLLFPGRPVCDFLCDTVSGSNPSAIFSVTLFPGRNRGNLSVPVTRHGGDRHIALRTTDPLLS